MLIYLVSCTRPDVAHSVSILSKYMQNPGKEHWEALKRVLRYLIGTQEYGIVFGEVAEEKLGRLEIWTDADHAGDADTRKSRSGYIVQLNGHTVNWMSKMQDTTALSTTEAEFVSLTEGVKEALYYRKLLAEMGIAQEGSTKIRVDNQGAIAVAKNPVDHPKTKHYDVKYCFVREIIARKDVELEYCRTDEMKADMLTKNLGGAAHERQLENVGVGLRSIQTSSRGGVLVSKD